MILLLVYLSLQVANTTALTSGSISRNRRKSHSRRQWLVSGLTVVCGVLGPAPVTSSLSTANAVDELPTALRRYTALAPLGSPSSTGAKTTGLSLADIAAQLTIDLTQGSTGKGGYFVSGDLTAELFRDDCVFIDPTNSVASLSRYRNALKILFDPEKSAVRLVSPLVINESERTLSGRVRSYGVLQLPWRPNISSYDTSIVYTVDEDGLIYSQAQKWSITASEALLETFTPGVLSSPFKELIGK